MTQEATKDFYRAIARFNDMYRLQGNEQPTLLGSERVRNFKNILQEEVNEAELLLERYTAMEVRNAGGELNPEERLAILTEMSDWLGDIIVYCTSEARRWGLPMDRILEIIMQSNFSKLGADGQPIYDERGKVLKGPYYWKPEPKIAAMLSEEKSNNF